MVKIIKLEPANDGKKKFIATFDDGKKTKFGAFGMNDYTITGDKDARERFRKRHAKDLETNDPQRPGYLSMFILWGDSTSLEQNVRAFNKRFG